jgi:hypothetical protein
VAEPARRQPRVVEVPPIDPQRVERVYRLHRARRRAYQERRRADRRAKLRFRVMLVALLGLSAYVSLSVWLEIERLFGI